MRKYMITVHTNKNLTDEEASKLEAAIRDATDVVAATVAYRTPDTIPVQVSANVPMPTQHYVNWKDARP